eukprot:scaffold2018_cov113-Cylindrotheca_fusiformis.AAC.7
MDINLVRRAGTSVAVLVSLVLFQGVLVFENRLFPVTTRSSTKNETTVIERRGNDIRNANAIDESRDVDSTDSEIAKDTTVVLGPPFQIFQVGTPRSASTFQFTLLCSLARWKGSEKTPCEFISGSKLESISFEEQIKMEIAEKRPFVYKTHRSTNSSFWKETSVFSSGGKYKGSSLYTQVKRNLQRCPVCEIKKYAPFFQLTTEEVSQMEAHMTLFGIIRQCCGFQMSKYEMQRLHGCDVTRYMDRIEYPHCEQYTKNISEIEILFHNSPIPYYSNNPVNNWAQPGDCQRFQNRIVSKKLGFNGYPFEGCVDL